MTEPTPLSRSVCLTCGGSADVVNCKDCTAWNPESEDCCGEPDERDTLAEEWLVAQHGPEWYIGNATFDDWMAAYAAVGEPPNRGQSET